MAGAKGTDSRAAVTRGVLGLTGELARLELHLLAVV